LRETVRELSDGTTKVALVGESRPFGSIFDETEEEEVLRNQV
jgi:hypothetical protein